MTNTQWETIPTAEIGSIFCNDPAEFCRLFSVHLQNPDEIPPQTSSLVGRIVRTKIPIEHSMLADDPGREIVFCLPNQSLNQCAQLEDVSKILPSLGFPKEEIRNYLEDGYKFYLVVFPNSEIFPADWDSIKRLFCEKYPTLTTTIDSLWDATTTIPFNQIDKSISLDTFLNLPIDQRTAQQLRGLLYSMWRLNKDFTGTGMTSEGIPEMLMQNQLVAQIPNVCWVQLAV